MEKNEQEQESKRDKKTEERFPPIKFIVLE